jgi:apoptosis-inducing factor 3
LQHDVEGQPEYFDVEIPNAEMIEDGTIMELPVGQGLHENVLISKYGGKLYATGAYCTYFGAPLSKGALFDDKVVCSTHGCGFSIASGALEYAPSQDGIPRYEIIPKKDGKSFVRIPKTLEQK